MISLNSKMQSSYRNYSSGSRPQSSENGHLSHQRSSHNKQSFNHTSNSFSGNIQAKDDSTGNILSRKEINRDFKESRIPKASKPTAPSAVYNKNLSRL